MPKPRAVAQRVCAYHFVMSNFMQWFKWPCHTTKAAIYTAIHWMWMERSIAALQQQHAIVGLERLHQSPEQTAQFRTIHIDGQLLPIVDGETHARFFSLISSWLVVPRLAATRTDDRMCVDLAALGRQDQRWRSLCRSINSCQSLEVGGACSRCFQFEFAEEIFSQIHTPDRTA